MRFQQQPAFVLHQRDYSETSLLLEVFTAHHGRIGLRRLASISRAYGLKDCHSFILGTRGESLDDVQRTLDFVEDLSPFAAIMLVWVDDGEVIDREKALQQRKFRDQIYGLLHERAAHQPRWVVPFLGIRFGKRLFDVIRRQGARGPLWQHLDSFSA